jgi:hypothetical protein
VQSGQTGENFTFDPFSDLKVRLNGLTTDQLATLRLSYAYRWRQSWLRGMGWVNLFLGGLTFLLGAGFNGNLVQTLLGLAIVGVSIWSIVSPLPIGVLIWTITLGVAGMWNIFVAVTNQGLAVGLSVVFCRSQE